MIPLRLFTLVAIGMMAIGRCSGAVNIACVGDSITAGVGVSVPTVESYPAKLQKLLGTNYSVQNDGLTTTTLLKNGDVTYWGTGVFINSHGRPVPHIVIIMLGSNDSKPQNWVYGTNFYSDYEALIATYTNVATHPRILICTPSPVFNSGYAGINPGIVATNISPLVRQLSSDLGVELIDMQSLLAGHGEWFPDNVHPNSKGTTVMAALINAALLGDTMNGSAPGLAITALPANKAVLNWPAAGAGWVLQSTTNLGDANAWTVIQQPAVTDGAILRVTNTVAGRTAIFRLWWPPN